MTSANATSFRKNLYALLEQTVKYNEPVTVTTKDGNAVLLSEDDYNGIMETLYLSSNPQVKNQILEALNEPWSDAIPENEVEW